VNRISVVQERYLTAGRWVKKLPLRNLLCHIGLFVITRGQADRMKHREPA